MVFDQEQTLTHRFRIEGFCYKITSYMNRTEPLNAKPDIHIVKLHFTLDWKITIDLVISDIDLVN